MIRTRIAAALRASGRGAISRAVVVSVGLKPDRHAVARRLVNLAAIYVSLADLLDPHAHPAAPRADVHARSDGEATKPVVPVRADVERVEGAKSDARPMHTADAQGGHGGEGSSIRILATYEVPDGWIVHVEAAGVRTVYGVHRAPGPVRVHAHGDPNITDPIGRVWTHEQAEALVMKRAREASRPLFQVYPGGYVTKGGRA